MLLLPPPTISYHHRRFFFVFMSSQKIAKPRNSLSKIAPARTSFLSNAVRFIVLLPFVGNSPAHISFRNTGRPHTIWFIFEHTHFSFFPPPLSSSRKKRYPLGREIVENNRARDTRVFPLLLARPPGEPGRG